MKNHPIESFLRAGYPLLWVQTHEIGRCIQSIKSKYTSRPVKVWDCVRGCDALGNESREPFMFVQKINSGPKEVVYFAVNLHLFLGQDGRQVIQAIKNNIEVWKENHISFVVVSPVVNIPPELERDFVLLTFDLPCKEELEKALVEFEQLTEEPEGSGQFYKVPTGEREMVIEAARGLTRQEAEDAFSLAYVTAEKISHKDVGRIKAQMVEKNKVLEFGDYKETFKTLGGLENLKDWTLNRFQNRKPGLPFRGILLLGVPGTGKSHFAKALGNEVGWPVLSLNFGKVFSEFVGSSERNMREALAVVDAMAPVILYIDEIEKGLAGASGVSTDSGVSKKVGGTFLSWLQDHESDVFVIATCNNLSELPAEYTRMGRWDGIFFVDLPQSEKERKAILNIYTEQFLGKPVSDFTMPDLTNYTGAELRQVVVEAAYNGGDWRRAAQFVVPLYKSSEKSIKQLRERAANCWTPATMPEAEKLSQAIGRRLDMGK